MKQKHIGDNVTVFTSLSLSPSLFPLFSFLSLSVSLYLSLLLSPFFPISLSLLYLSLSSLYYLSPNLSFSFSSLFLSLSSSISPSLFPFPLSSSLSPSLSISLFICLSFSLSFPISLSFSLVYLANPGMLLFAHSTLMILKNCTKNFSLPSLFFPFAFYFSPLSVRFSLFTPKLSSHPLCSLLFLFNNSLFPPHLKFAIPPLLLNVYIKISLFPSCISSKFPFLHSVESLGNFTKRNINYE